MKQAGLRHRLRSRLRRGTFAWLAALFGLAVGDGPASALPTPKYLAVPGFSACLKSQQQGTYTTLCLPAARPPLCKGEAWRALNALQGSDRLPACPQR